MKWKEELVTEKLLKGQAGWGGRRLSLRLGQRIPSAINQPSVVRTSSLYEGAKKDVRWIAERGGKSGRSVSSEIILFVWLHVPIALKQKKELKKKMCGVK